MAPTQLRLDFGPRRDFSRASFIVSVANGPAVSALDGWFAWRGGALALVGPAGSGKTHLATAWAAETGASVLSPDLDPRDLADLHGPAVVEDADQAAHGEALFHLINMAARPGHALLMTARTPPSGWTAEVPDLRSRLNALPVAELHEPDDVVLRGLLDRFFQEKHITPSAELVSYLVRRIERSAPRARAIVAELEAAADAQRRPISRALAKILLGGEPEIEDP